MSDHIDLGSGDRPGDLRVVLVCRNCGEEAPPVRRTSDPTSVVRCADCGRKHSVDALEAR